VKHGNQVQVRDGRGEYTPTPKELRRNAMRLLRDEQRQQGREAWMQARADGSTISLREALYRDAIANAAQVMASAADGHRVRMVEVVMEHELECQRLKIELNGGKPEPRTRMSPEDIRRLGETQREELKAERQGALR
jgi:hypothetical protein